MIKFILILILIIMVLRSLSRLFMPFMVSEMQKKAQQSMNEQYRRQQAQQKKAEGEIHVDYAPPKAKKRFSFTKSNDDFVDYEEIKK